MDKSLLITLFVPTTDAAGTDHGGRRGVIGTGYPVGPDLILTARHLLEPDPPEARDPRHPVRVRWHYHRQGPPAGPDGWITLGPDSEVWSGAPTLDAVLLRCPRPATAAGWGICSAERPADGLDWASEGFPNAADWEGLRHPCAFGGTCFSKADAEDWFELEARAPPADEDDWRGASGMPIFVGRRILGIAQRVPRRFGGERLHATPCWKLLADPAFRAALGQDRRAARLAAVHRELAGHLAPHPACRAALAAELDPAPVLAGLNQEAAAACLTTCLLEQTDIRRAIPALRQAHRTLAAAAGPETAEPLVAAARLVVPVLFDQGVVLQTRGLLGLALVPLPAATRTVAELIMAGVDGRPALYRPRTDEHDQPAGVLSLPLHPEQGIGTDPGAALAAHVSRKLDPGRDAVQGLRAVVDDYLLGAYSRTDPGAPARSRAQRILLTADLLEDLRRDTGHTLYMVFYLPEDPDERTPVEALAADLKRDYPAIAFLALDPTPAQERADRRLVDPLCRMLPLRTS